MRYPYDIFAGHSAKNAKWIEMVVGLEQARQRMREIADEKPGNYFLFNADADAIVDRVSTMPKREGAPLRELVLLNEAWTCSDCAWVFKASGPPAGNSLDEMKENYRRQRDQQFAYHVCGARASQ